MKSRALGCFFLHTDPLWRLHSFPSSLGCFAVMDHSLAASMALAALMALAAQQQCLGSINDFGGTAGGTAGGKVASGGKAGGSNGSGGMAALWWHCQPCRRCVVVYLVGQLDFTFNFYKGSMDGCEINPLQLPSIRPVSNCREASLPVRESGSSLPVPTLRTGRRRCRNARLIVSRFFGGGGSHCILDPPHGFSLF